MALVVRPEGDLPYLTVSDISKMGFMRGETSKLEGRYDHVIAVRRLCLAGRVEDLDPWQQVQST